MKKILIFIILFACNWSHGFPIGRIVIVEDDSRYNNVVPKSPRSTPNKTKPIFTTIPNDGHYKTKIENCTNTPIGVTIHYKKGNKLYLNYLHLAPNKTKVIPQEKIIGVQFDTDTPTHTYVPHYYKNKSHLQITPYDYTWDQDQVKMSICISEKPRKKGFLHNLAKLFVVS